MKTIFRNHVKLLTALACGFVFSSASRALSQELKQVSNPPQAGTFWLLSSEVDNNQSPPFPFDPYGGALPIYEMKGFPGQYVVADSSEDYQQLQAEKSLSMQMSLLESDGPPIPGDGGGSGEGGGGISYSPQVFTNALEELLFDTTGSSSNGVLAS